MAFGRIAELLGNFEISEWLLCIGLAYVLFECLRQIHILLERHFQLDQKIRFRIILQLGLNIICSLFVIGLGISVFFILVLGFRNLSSFSVEMWTMNAIYAALTLAYSSVISSIYVLKIKDDQAWSEAQHRQQKLALSLIRYNQEIQPELLYAGLEALIPYLYHEPEAADELIQKLSKVYRYQLEKRNQELVRLSEELKAIQIWLYIWQQKYPNQIFWESQIELNNIDYWLPPGSLASSVSHLIQHILFSPLQPLNIKIFIDNKTLKIQSQRNDRLINLPIGAEALDLLKENYASFTEIEIKESLNEETRIISLPLLEKGVQESKMKGSS